MELTVFEKKYLESFKQLSELKKEQDRLAEIEKNVKAEIEKAMDDNDIVSVKNDYVTITRVAASESKSIDLKALQDREPKLYEDLIADYPKVTTKKAYIRIVVK
jgi:hypothetical protein